MPRFLRLIITLLLASLALAQEKAATNLPSEETVNSFLQQTFGYDSSLTWKVSSIKPSVAEGLAEVTVVISSPKGQSATTFFVTPDGKHAWRERSCPLAPNPTLRRKKLCRGGSMGRRKALKGARDDRGVQRPAMPALQRGTASD